MMMHIPKPAIVPAAGTRPKVIEEYIGRVSSGTSEVSIARMQSPPGWVEPPQTPEFNEYTLVLRGALHIRQGEAETIVQANEAFIAAKGVEVQYSTPGPEGAEYIAVCIPAFSVGQVHRRD